MATSANVDCPSCSRLGVAVRYFRAGVAVTLCAYCDFGVCSCGLPDPSGKANLCRCGAWIRLLPETCEEILKSIDDLPTTLTAPNN